MKKIRSLLCLALCGVLALTGCGRASAREKDPDKLQVIATIFPPYDFVRQIAGEAAQVSMLLPPGSEAHSFEPTAQDILAIQGCDLFIYTGSESDVWVERILNTMDQPPRRVVALLDLVDTLPEELVEGMEHREHDHDHGEEDHDHGDENDVHPDEHVWTSPQGAIALVQGLSGILGELDEENAPVYARRAEEYVAQLAELDAAFGEMTQNAARHTVVFGDRFPFRYLADDYGLTYCAAYAGCAADGEPSAATIAFLVDKVRQEEIPAVFTIEFSNGKIADAICEETGAKKLLLHSCHNVTKTELENGVTYLDLMNQNVEALREALG